MKAVFSARQMGHNLPRIFLDGTTQENPDSTKRVKALLKGVRMAGISLFAAKKCNEEFVSTVHPPAYTEFLKTGYDEFCAVIGKVEAVFPSLSLKTEKPLHLEHIVAKTALHLSGTACPLVADTWSTAVASVETALTAADHLLAGDRFAYALCRPSGHLAGANYARNFCYLNNAALAATRLLEKFNPVAILDIGLHHGAGTQEIFIKRNDVFYASIHVNPERFFPYLSGYEKETGQGAGNGFNLNIQLPVGAGDTFWLSAVEYALKKVDDNTCKAVIISMGLDIHHSDPANGAIVSSNGLKRIAQMVATIGIPVLIVQEECSFTPQLSENLALFLSEVSS